MTAAHFVSNATAQPLPLQEQATTLWIFLQPTAKQFSYNAAFQVVEALAIKRPDNPKSVAKRLRDELRARRVVLKQDAALKLAAKFLGYESWHDARAKGAHLRLKLIDMASFREELVEDWSAMAHLLCERAEAQLSPIFQVSVGSAHILISTVEDLAAMPATNSITPRFLITPAIANDTWSDGAHPALETFRRSVEQKNKGVMDGFAVLTLCANSGDDARTLVRQPVTLLDAANSELILERADNPLDNGYELARGDEVNCWCQLELAREETRNQDSGFVVDEEDGSWHCGDERYVWSICTIHPADFIPGMVVSSVSVDDSKRLLARYHAFKCIITSPARRHHETKTLDAFGNLPDSIRVNLHRLLLEMKRAGLTWEAYCENTGQQVAMATELPLGFVFSLVQTLALKDPNSVFARPTRSELLRVKDDRLLRSLLPRVDHVLYKLPLHLESETKADVVDAVDDFSASIRLLRLTEQGIFVGQGAQLPYLVYANDGEELRCRLEQHGLVIFVGVMPRLFKAPEITERIPEAWPFAIGRALYLDIDRDT